MLTIVVNYYNPTGSQRIRSMTQFAMQCLATYTSQPFRVLLADGTGCRDDVIAGSCAEQGWRYLPSQQKEPFAVTYNRGLREAEDGWRVLMANDIFVVAGWDQRLVGEMERTGAWMAVPYLSNSDYLAQVFTRPLALRTFRPNFMTINLNVLSPKCCETVGQLDESFSGGFNDIDYLIRIRQAGGDCIIAYAGEITHCGRATVSVSTSWNLESDTKAFAAKYPKLRFNAPFDGSWPLFCRSRVYRSLLWAARRVPFKALRRIAVESATRFEPVFHNV